MPRDRPYGARHRRRRVRQKLTRQMLLSTTLFSRWPTLLAIWWRRWSKPGHESGLARRHKMSFIVFRLDALGDVVLTTPLFRELKRSFPDARCTVVVQEAYRSILVTNPDVDEILTVPVFNCGLLPHRSLRLLSAIVFWWTRIKGRRFDVVLSPRWDEDEHLATFLCLVTNAGARVGYTSQTSMGKRLRNQGFHEAFDICLPAGPLQHEALRNLAIVEALGGSVEDSAIDIRITSRDRLNAAEILQTVNASSILVGVGIGAAVAGRRWPLDSFAQVLEGLARHFSVQPVILCSASEREQATNLAQRLDTPPIVISGPELRKTCAILERCDLFIGNDSGPAHLAAAMNCKTIVISRHPLSGDPNHANSPLRFGPRVHDSRVLQPAQGRDGCTKACVRSGPHCISTVTVEQVLAAALEMLAPHPDAISKPPVQRLQTGPLPFLVSRPPSEHHVRV